MSHPVRCHRRGAAAVFATGVCRCAQTRTAQPGGPLPGITPVEFEEFRLGLDDFLEVEAAEEGLGPAFNGTSCAVCHNVPVVGGVGIIAEMRAGRVNDAREFETLDGTGETLFHLFSVPGHALPADRAGRRQRDRAARAHSALRRRARRSHSRRHAARARGSVDRNGDGVSGRARSSSTSRPASGASAVSAGRRSTRRC